MHLLWQELQQRFSNCGASKWSSSDTQPFFFRHNIICNLPCLPLLKSGLDPPYPLFLIFALFCSDWSHPVDTLKAKYFHGSFWNKKFENL